MSGECPRLDDAGAYVLHALEEAEARDYATHLATCEVCTAEVARLQPVVDTLPMAAPQMSPPAGLRGRIMATVESEAELLRAAGPEADRVAPAAAAPESTRRRLWTWRRRPGAAFSPAFAATAAVVLVLAGAGTGLLLAGGEDSEPVRTVAAEMAPEGAAVAVELHDGRGTLVARDLPAPPPGRVYQVWLLRGEVPEPTHTLFTVRPDGRAAVEIDEPVEGASQVLVTEEPSGGSDVPSAAPVIAASLES